MILVTGATGFVGRSLLPRLVEGGHPVRVLLRPARQSPRLPRGVPVQVALAHLDDERSLRAAVSGVDAVIHLVGAEWRGPQADLLVTDAGGTRRMAEAAAAAGVKRFIYLSHLGADRASGYPVLKAKGIAEEFIRQSGVPFTILRSALLFGPDDMFVNVLAALIKFGPGVFFMPGDGRTALQPLWVDDLATCIEWSLAEGSLLDQTVSIGGPEFVPLRAMVDMLMEVLGVRRLVAPVRPVYLRGGAWFLEQLLPRSPVTTRWLDYLAISRTCELTSVTRHFGLKPARFSPATLGYLRNKRWLPELRRFVFGT
ncbi:MAG: NAD(P)H-binding protein [Anaerolineales bacterium]|nr:NAD(P)H-binding protein [Anaerolineales bacterium]